jgi:transcription elongation GreA/GreB family factor
LIAGRLADSGLTTRKLAVVRVAVCAAPSYLRRRGIPFRPQDLVLHDCVSHSIRQGSDDLDFHTDEGTVSMTSLSRLVVDDARFLREAAVCGLGIVMLPELLVVDDLAAGRLMRVLDDFQTIELGVHALHPHGRLAPASVRALLDHLAVSFREPPWEGRSVQAAVTPRKAKGPSIPMTEQDVRRLSAVAALFDEEDPPASAQLRSRIARAKTMPASKIPRDAITMNSRMSARDDRGGERELSLVYPWDKARDRISVTSALGLALLGSSVGARIEDGERKLTIKTISYQPEAAGDNHL